MSITSGVILESPWKNYSEMLIGLITTAYLIGAAVGSFFGGFISDRLGPKKMLGASSVISLVASIILAIQMSQLWLLIVLRMITGLGVGIATSIGPLYISEQANPKYRGMLGSLFQLFVCIGQLLAFSLNFVFSFDSHEAWRLEFFIAGLFAAVFLIGYVRLPESAGFLAVQGVEKETLFKDIKDVLTAAISSKRAFIVGVVLASLQQFTGINAFMFYSPSMFASFGWKGSLTVVGSLIVGGFSTLSVIIAFFLVDRLGRKPLLLAGWSLMLVGNILMLIVGFAPSLPILPFGLSGLLIFLFGFQIGPGPVFFVVVSELYAVEIRGKAMGLIVFVNWLSNIVLSLFFPYLFKGMQMKVFLIFGILSLVSVLFVFFVVQETQAKRNATFEDADATEDPVDSKINPNVIDIEAGTCTNTDAQYAAGYTAGFNAARKAAAEGRATLGKIGGGGDVYMADMMGPIPALPPPVGSAGPGSLRPGSQNSLKPGSQNSLKPGSQNSLKKGSSGTLRRVTADNYEKVDDSA